MAKSIADELYSEILKQSNGELGPRSTSDTKHCNSHDHVGDEVWHEDGISWNGSDEELDGASDLEREWRRRRDQFHTIGYRDGLMAAKEASAQEGFNVGFGESVFVGYKWGLVRGVASTLACLPDGLREKLVESEEKRIKFLHLQKSVCSLSTTDALKVFHDDLSNESVKHNYKTESTSQTVFHDDLSNESVKHNYKTESTSQTADAHNQASNDNLLETYYEELQSLVLESPALEVHLGVDH